MKHSLIFTGLIGISLIASSCARDNIATEDASPQLDETKERLSTGQVLDAITDENWRDISQDNTLYMTLDNGGQIIIELAPQFAPAHVSNIKTLVGEDYFDGLHVIRSHDNYVAQWGEAETETPRSLGSAKPALDPEWESDWSSDLPVTLMPDGDIYQADAGYAYGFPVAGNKAKGSRRWFANRLKFT